MTRPKPTPDLLGDLFKGQKLAVLGTLLEGRPYGNLVAFAASDDLREIVFATSRATRKFTNILQDQRVSLVVDNRSNRTVDFRHAVAATVLGSASVVADSERESGAAFFLEKHPYLKDFVNAPTCALLKIRVEKYIVVYRFQNVVEMEMIP